MLTISSFWHPALSSIPAAALVVSAIPAWMWSMWKINWNNLQVHTAAECPPPGLVAYRRTTALLFSPLDSYLVGFVSLTTIINLPCVPRGSETRTLLVELEKLLCSTLWSKRFCSFLWFLEYFGFFLDFLDFIYPHSTCYPKNTSCISDWVWGSVERPSDWGSAPGAG